jgi:hypothetical protein
VAIELILAQSIYRKGQTMQLTTSRVVTLLTPVFAATSAVLTAWLGKHCPGIGHISSSGVVALEITGATTAVGIVAKWLDGLSKSERQKAEHDAFAVQQAVNKVVTVADKADPGIAAKAETEVKDLVEKAAPIALNDVGAPADAWPEVEKVAGQVEAAAVAPSATVVAAIVPADPAPVA